MASANAYPGDQRSLGRILTYQQDVIVTDGLKEMIMKEKRTFITRARVLSVTNEERETRRLGAYHSIMLAAPDGRLTFAHACGDLRQQAERLVKGAYYSFEGVERTDRGRGGELIRYLRLTKIVNLGLEVTDAVYEPAEPSPVIYGDVPQGL